MTHLTNDMIAAASSTIDDAIKHTVIATDCTTEEFELNFNLNTLVLNIYGDTGISIGYNTITELLELKVREIAQAGFANIPSGQVRDISVYPEKALITKSPLLTFKFFVNHSSDLGIPDHFGPPY